MRGCSMREILFVRDGMWRVKAGFLDIMTLEVGLWWLISCD